MLNKDTAAQIISSVAVPTLLFWGAAIFTDPNEDMHAAFLFSLLISCIGLCVVNLVFVNICFRVFVRRGWIKLSQVLLAATKIGAFFSAGILCCVLYGWLFAWFPPEVFVRALVLVTPLPVLYADFIAGTCWLIARPDRQITT